MPAPLTPRSLLFGNPTRTWPTLSHDGRLISYLAPVDGVLNVWAGPANDIAAARPITHDRKRGIRAHFWAFDGETILYLQDLEGDENWQVYAIDHAGKEARSLTPLAGVQARVTKLSHRIPGAIVVGLNDRNPELHDLHVVELAPGKASLLERNEGFSGFVLDDSYTVRLGDRMEADGGRTIQRRVGANWQPFISIPVEDALTTYALGFDAAARELYLVDSRGRDTSALFSMDVATGEARLLAEDPRADVGHVVRHPVTKRAQAVAFTYEKDTWTVLDDDLSGDIRLLESAAEGEFGIAARTLDDTRWIVGYGRDDGPDRYYRYDRSSRALDLLFSTRPELENVRLSKMHPVVIPARDGLPLVSYLTLPAGSDARTPGRPQRPVPMVLYVHGGPAARDHWGYNAYHQWLANRGYAVMSVNYRGSTGFGKKFLNAAIHEWGRKMHDDLVDAVRWAIAEKIAQPEKVAIAGGSYGGYATLVGLTMTPDLFACGVDLVGPSNLLTLLNTIPPYWKPIIKSFHVRIGDPATEEGRRLLEERSPLNYVDRIKRPLLIGQGKNDPRVKVSESDQVVEAMQSKGIPVTYLLYPDEGHGFGRPENAISFNAVSEAFLAACLGGRIQPVGDDFQGASITVPVGAAHVPGLAEALQAR